MNRAVCVGAQRANACRFEAIQDFGTWVSVGIAFAGRNNRNLRVHGRKKLGRGGVFAAVMADLQNVGVNACLIVFGQDGAFDSLFRIAGEEQGAVSKFQVQDERVVVFCGRCDFRRRDLGPEEFAYDPVPCERFAAYFMFDLSAALFRG